MWDDVSLHGWNMAIIFSRWVNAIAWSETDTMSSVTTRRHTCELGCMCGPVQLSHPPGMPGRCDCLPVKVLLLHAIPCAPPNVVEVN